MLRNHVEASIQDHHHHKLLPPLLHSTEISENKAKIRKKKPTSRKINRVLGWKKEVV
jgi:hypothetical protein